MKGQELILFGLEEIIYNGGEGNSFIINIGLDFYIQMACCRGDYEVICEAVSNRNIEVEEAKLSLSQKEKLYFLGWSADNPYGDNYFMKLPVDSSDKRAELVLLFVETAKEVYGAEEIREEDLILNLYSEDWT